MTKLDDAREHTKRAGRKRGVLGDVADQTEAIRDALNTLTDTIEELEQRIATLEAAGPKP